MGREGFYLSVGAIIVGGLALVGVFTGFVGLSVALLIAALGATVTWKALDRSNRRSPVRDGAGVGPSSTVWILVRDELAEVVRVGGRVTRSESAWTRVPSVSRLNSPATFPREMDRYVGQRRKVASLVASRLSTDEEIRQLESAQHVLLSVSRELLPQARTIVEGMRGADARDTGAAGAATAKPAAANTIAAPTPTPVRQRATAKADASPPRRQPGAVSAGPPPRRPGAVSAGPPPRRPGAVSATPRRQPGAVSAGPQRQPRAADSRPSGEAVLAAPAAPSEGAEAVPQRVGAQAMPQSGAVPPSPAGEGDAAPPRMDESDLDSMSVCAALFDSKLMSYETNRLFDQQYKGQTIRWEGTLRRASAYSYDFTFGDGGGTKAELDIHEVKQRLGTRMVRAYVQLPRSDAGRVSARVGEVITFEGRLLTCEGSSGRIYVGGGRVVG